MKQKISIKICRDRRPRRSNVVTIIKCTSVCNLNNENISHCRGDHRSSEVVSVIAAHPSIDGTTIYISPVGVGALDDPMSYRLQNASSSVIKTTKIYLTVGATIGRPSSLRLQNAPPSVAQKHGLQKPSPVGEHVAKRLSSLQATVEGTACGG